MAEEKNTKTRSELLQEWGNLSEKEDINALAQFITSLHPADAADLIELLGGEEKMKVFSTLTAEQSAEVLFELNAASRDHILDELETGDLSEIVEMMDTDDAADIVGELDDLKATEVLKDLEHEDREDIRTLLKYSPETAGGTMQLEICTVFDNQTVAEAVEIVRHKAKEMDRIYNVFVTDPHGRLMGRLPMDRLLLEPDNRHISEIYDPDVTPIPVTLDQEEVARIFRREDEVSLPVVDSDGILVGRITADDVMDIIEEEHSEDLLRMVGAGEDEKALDSPLVAVRNRIPWLISYLFAGFLTASVVDLFQATIEQVVVLAALMPIVGGMGGNSGTQSLAVIVRSIATGDMEVSLFWRALRKEMLVGLINGSINGVIVCLFAYFYVGNIYLGLVLGGALMANMVMAGFAGTTIPTLLKLLRIDPATSSGVIVTTFTDIAGFTTFLVLATIFIKYLSV